MRKKIVSIVICTLMLCVAVPAVTGIGTINADNNVVKNVVVKNSLSIREDWLHYDDGTCENSLGLTSGGVMHEVIKLTPDELSGYENSMFTNIRVMHGYPDGSPQPAQDYQVWMFTGTTHPTDPMTEATIVASGTSPEGNDWVNVSIDHYAFTPDDTVWIGVAWTQAAGTFPAGFDTGTNVPDKGGWIYSSATGWTQLHLVGFPGAWNLWVEVEMANQPPDTPAAPTGPSTGVKGVEYTFSAITIDPESDQVFFFFDWGDGTNSSWVGPFDSGVTGTAKHTYNDVGTFSIIVKAKDTNGGESGWSDSHSISISEGAPILKIQSVSGGLFKIKASIKNIGTIVANNVQWTINLVGGAFIGKDSSGSITSIAPGAEAAISSKFILGFGKTAVTITATIPESTDTMHFNATILLFFIKI